MLTKHIATIATSETFIYTHVCTGTFLNVARHRGGKCTGMYVGMERAATACVQQAKSSRLSGQVVDVD